MWALAIIIGLIGIIVLFVYYGMNLSKEYWPVKLLLWLCVPLLIEVGFFVMFKLATSDFTSTTADIFETLFVTWTRFLILFYIYFPATWIVKFVKNFRAKKYAKLEE